MKKTEQQRESLKELGETIGQGFLFRAPLSAMDAKGFLDRIL